MPSISRGCRVGTFIDSSTMKDFELLRRVSAFKKNS